MVGEYNISYPCELEQDGYELVDFVPKKDNDAPDSLEIKLISNKFRFSFKSKFHIKVLKVICGGSENEPDVNYLQSCTYAKIYGNHFAIYVQPKDAFARERNILKYQFNLAYDELLDAEDMSDAEKYDDDYPAYFFEPRDYDEFDIDEDELFWDERTRKIFDKETGRKTLEDIVKFASQEECLDESEYESFFEKDSSSYDMERFDNEDSDEDWFFYGPGHIYGPDYSFHTTVDEEENEICWDEGTKQDFEEERDRQFG